MHAVAMETACMHAVAMKTIWYFNADIYYTLIMFKILHYYVSWFLRYSVCPVYDDFGHYLDHVQATIFYNVS